MPQITIQPFWNRLSDISLYPFRGAALISLVVYSLGSLLGFLPGIGWILQLVIWVASYRYAFEILVRTAHGQMDAPEFATHTDTGVVWRFIVLWLICLFLFLLASLLGGPWLGILTLLLLSLLLPGAIISLAMDGSLPQALDPRTAFAIMSRIGAPYFAAFGLLFVIQVSAATAGNWLAQFMPPFLAELLATTASLWGLFVAFHLMGYLCFQYHEALGFEPEEHGKAHSGPRTRDSTLMEEAEALVADGQVDTAIARIAQEMQERAVPIPAHELYRKLLHSRGDQARLQAHASLYLNLLMMEKQQERRALALLREALDIDRSFTSPQPEEAHRLARRARDLGQTQLALDIWLPMIKRWPREPGSVDWALEAADLLIQRNRLALARQMLGYVAHGLEGEPRRRIDALLATLPADAQDA